MNKPGAYATITSLKELRALRDYLLDDSVECIYYDTETTGLDWQVDELLCISFSGGVGEGFVVPILWNPGDNIPDVYPAWIGKFDKVVDILREIFGSAKDKCGQNQLFDLRFMERDPTSPWIDAVTAMGLKVNGRLRDTELNHHAIAESLPHNMTTTLALYTDMAFYEGTGIQKYKKAMWKAPNDMLWEYSARDADGLPRLEAGMRPIIEREGTDYVLDNITLPMLRVCREIEDNGFPVDVDYFKRLCQFYDQEIARAEGELWRAVPHMVPGWKYNYAPTLRQVLFQDLGIQTSGRKTDSGRGCKDCDDGICFKHDSTGKDALLEIAAVNPHPALNAIIELKNLTKRRNTYLDGGRGGMARFIKRDHRIHQSMKISRTETGRLASEKPNGQNIPNYVHIHPAGHQCHDSSCKAYYSSGTFSINTTNAFHDIIRAGPGKAILNVDWSQLEIWVLAYRIYSDIGDRTLLDVLESGLDIHTWMARKMYPNIDADLNDKEWRGLHDVLRRRAKTANFGIGYCLTVQGYMAKEGCTQEEAEEIFKLFKSIVPIDRWFRFVTQGLEKRGYIENEFRRRRHMQHLPIIKAIGTQGDYNAAIREGINFPIQSTGSDLHSAASYRCLISEALSKRGAKIILSVHDSLTFEVDSPNNDYVIQTAWVVKNIFQDTAVNLLRPNGTALNWKIPVEVEFGVTWGQMTTKLNARGTLENAANS